MDLAKEKEWLPPSSPSSTVDWIGGKKLFWPLFWSYTDSSEDSNNRSGVEEVGEEEEEDYSLDYGSEEPLPSGVGGDWDTHWNEGWDQVQSYHGNLCQVACLFNSLLLSDITILSCKGITFYTGKRIELTDDFTIKAMLQYETLGI